MIRLLTISFLMVLGLTACGGNNSTLPTSGSGDGAGSGAAADGATGTGANTSGLDGSGGIGVVREVPGQGDGPLSRLVIYFEFDRSEIRPDFNDMLRAHGAYLAKMAAVRFGSKVMPMNAAAGSTISAWENSAPRQCVAC